VGGRRVINILNNNSTAMDLLSALANLSFIIYIPFVLIELRQANKAERNEEQRRSQERKNAIYTQLIERYVAWQRLCLEYIDLDIADYPEENPRPLTPVQAKQEQLALGILIELFEEAFLAYLDAPPEMRSYQWRGWELYIDDYCAKPNFRKVWNLSRPNMDLRFSEFMEEKIQAKSAA
jgi:hypothetical protein